METKQSELLFAGFNQDNQCFSVGTNNGFRIYNTDKFSLKFERILDMEIAMVIMLYRTNILALVGSDNNMNNKRNKLIIWDDNQRKPLSELNKIFVVCRDKIYVFNLSTFKNMDTLETGDNSHGIVGVSFVQEQTILAYPDKIKGHVRIKNYEKSSTFSIKAHENNIAYISVSYDGNLIATASEQGTLIRIFGTETGDKLQEVRRGKDKADIKHICFSSDYRFLAASSSKGTIHIWSLAPTLKKLNKSVENEIENKKSGLKWLPGFLGGDFFGSEWSFAKVRITDHRSICCFGSENSIIIVSTNGKYYKAEIDLEKGGDCKIIEEQQLLQ